MYMNYVQFLITIEVQSPSNTFSHFQLSHRRTLRSLIICIPYHFIILFRRSTYRQQRVEDVTKLVQRKNSICFKLYCLCTVWIYSLLALGLPISVRVGALSVRRRNNLWAHTTVMGDWQIASNVHLAAKFTFLVAAAYP
jgi:hypothetical protein